MNNFKELLHKYNSGQATPEEQAIIEAWYQQMEAPGLVPITGEQLNDINGLKLNTTQPAKVKRLIAWLSAAAALLLITGTSVYFLTKPTPVVQQVAQLPHDALPGSNKAVLTLANGRKIILNSLQKGTVAQQGNVVVEKKADGELTYEAAGKQETTTDQPAAPMFNTVSTPRGGQHHLILADGTGVWLNAASSVRYPTVFSGNERRVEITGEAYFEVAHNADKPFRVVCSTQTVEVLGTHFNINAYADEPVVTTTLLQGSVRITTTDAGTFATLKPGQQSLLAAGNQLKVAAADTETAIDWKEGDFVFKSQTLPAIMRKVSRWYNVDVNYGGYHNSKLTFSGVVSRSRNLSAVLAMLQSTGAVKFAVHDNVLSIISNKN